MNPLYTFNVKKKQIEVVHFHVIGSGIHLITMNSVYLALQYDLNMKMTICL